MVQDDTSNEVYHEDDDPISYEEAMWSLDCKKWLEAMESEIESMKIKKSMEFNSSFKGYKTNWLLIGIQEKDLRRWEGRDLQSLLCCQGISSKERYKLWRNLFSYGNVQINSDSSCYSSILWLWDMTNGCENDFP